MDRMLVFTGWVVYESCSLEGLDLILRNYCISTYSTVYAQLDCPPQLHRETLSHNIGRHTAKKDLHSEITRKKGR